ncbi:MAG: molybdopterin-dependent oxidoreductase [Chloroflexia bacterium]
MIEAAATGAVRAMYVKGPTRSRLGDSARAERALSNLEFLVVQDMFLTETARLADVVLPACSWAEKDGTYTSAERRVQRLNKALQSRGESRPDGAILLQVFERMGRPLGNSSTDDVLGEIASAAPSYAGITRALLDARTRL